MHTEVPCALPTVSPNVHILHKAKKLPFVKSIKLTHVSPVIQALVLHHAILSRVAPHT